jgi:hypothetical protein
MIRKYEPVRIAFLLGAEMVSPQLGAGSQEMDWIQADQMICRLLP